MEKLCLCGSMPHLAKERQTRSSYAFLPSDYACQKPASLSIKVLDPALRPSICRSHPPRSGLVSIVANFIDSTLCPRIATQEPLYRPADTLRTTKTLYRLDRIHRTGGIEFTLAVRTKAPKRPMIERQRSLIEPNTRHKDALTPGKID